MDVQMPDGTIIRGVPEGTTKAQLQAKLSQYQQAQPQKYPEMRAIPEGADVSEYFTPTDQFAGQDFTPKPGWQLPYPTGPTTEERATHRKMVVPAMATAGAVISGGLTLPALALSALGAGTGATGGKIIEQKLEGKPVDLADAVGEGSKAAAYTAAGGLAFKSLGALATSIFSPVSKEIKDVAKYAIENKLPLPGATLPGKSGALAQYVEQATFPSRIASINDAKKINTFLNRQTQQLSPDAKLLDEVAQNGQAFFKNVFSTAKETGEGGYDKFLNAIGEDTMVAMPRTVEAMREAVLKMKAESIGGPLMSKLSGMLKQGTGDLPLKRLDTVRKDIGNIIKQKKNNNVYEFGKAVQEAIKNDYDTIGAQMGISAKDLVNEAIAKYAKFSAIKQKYPYLERFSKEFGARGGTAGSKQWFGELFTERNAGALNYIRKESPELYRELADTHLAQILAANTKAETGLFGKVIDGDSLLTELNASKNTLIKIYGAEKYNVLKNFANYVKQVGPALKTKPMGGMESAARLGGAAAGMTYQPGIYLSGEAAAYLLAKGLSNPKSILYKAFLKEAKFGTAGTRMGALAATLNRPEEQSQEQMPPQLQMFGNF